MALKMLVVPGMIILNKAYLSVAGGNRQLTIAFTLNLVSS
jgi:hypothetical protein